MFSFLELGDEIGQANNQPDSSMQSALAAANIDETDTQKVDKNSEENTKTDSKPQEAKRHVNSETDVQPSGKRRRLTPKRFDGFDGLS